MLRGMDKQIVVLENILIHYDNSYLTDKILWIFNFLMPLLEVQGFNINRRKGYDETLAIDCVQVRDMMRHWQLIVCQ